MAYDNTVTIVGNLTRDPELRFTPSGQATATFGVAVNRRGQNRQSQEREEATSFLDVVCWGQLAENAAQSLTRGTRVVVSGRLDQRSWENQEGEKRSKIEITADEVSPEPALGDRRDHQERASEPRQQRRRRRWRRQRRRRLLPSARPRGGAGRLRHRLTRNPSDADRAAFRHGRSRQTR